MCDPVTLGIAVASKLGSSYFEGKAADAVAGRRKQVIASADQDLSQNRARALQGFRQSLEQSTPEKLQASTAEAADKREQAYIQNIRQDDLSPEAAGGSEAAKRAIVKALGEAVSNSTQKAKARAAVDAYNDALFGRDVTFSRARQNIGQQGNFAAGRANVADLELQAAPSAGRKYANLAGIVDTLGTVAGGVRGYGAGEGWWGGYDPKTDIYWKTGRQV